MTHQPPDITDAELRSDGTVYVQWQVDPILLADPPQRVEVLVNGNDAPNHSDTDITISEQEVQASGASITIEIAYLWNEFPNRESSAVVLPLTSSFHVASPTVPQKPAIALKLRSPKTLDKANSITVTWSSYSITNADMYWGSAGAPNRHVGLPVSTQHYGGDFTTDAPLVSGGLYEFNIVVKNSLDQWGPYSARIIVRAESNYRSVKQFMAASGKHGPSLASAFGAQGRSFRSMLGV